MRRCKTSCEYFITFVAVSSLKNGKLYNKGPSVSQLCLKGLLVVSSSNMMRKIVCETQKKTKTKNVLVIVGCLSESLSE